jgi:hypothetical protein
MGDNQIPDPCHMMKTMGVEMVIVYYQLMDIL